MVEEIVLTGRIVQVATGAAEGGYGHSLYALTNDGKLYERVYELTSEGTTYKWKEIREEEFVPFKPD